MSDTYAKRQHEQELREKYREHARKIATTTSSTAPAVLSVETHAHVGMMDHGAFVEVQMWIPRSEVDRG